MTLTTNASTDTLTIAHTDTSTLSGTYGGNNNGIVIEDITVDTNGHITDVGTRDLDGRYDNYNHWSLFVDGVDKDNVTSGEKVDFAATAPLSVAHSFSSGNVLTWTHDASGVTAGSYGQTGAEDGQYIKSITVNATGHVTAVSSDDFDNRYDNYSSWTARDHDGTSYTVTSGDVLQYKEGTGMDVNFTADDVLTFTNTDRGSSQAIFKNIAVTDQNTIVADSNNDTLTVVGGGAITVTTNATTDTLTIAHSDTSTQASVNNTGRTYIQDVTLDAYGHVTALTSATETVVNTDTNTTYSINAVASDADAFIRLTAGGSGSGTDNVKLVAGSNVTLTTSGDNITIAATNTQRPIHDTPVDGATTTSISSNWAFDNVKTAVPANAVFTDTGTNLSFSRDTNGLTVTSSTGDNVSLPAATDSLWGVMTDGMVTKLNSIAQGAEVNQNAFSTFELGTFSTGGGGGTDITANSKTTELKLQFQANAFDTAVNNTTKVGTVSLETDQRGTIKYIGEGATNYLNFANASSMGIYFSSALDFLFSAGGNFHAEGNVTAFSTSTSSDAKLKTNIQKVEGALDKVCALDGVTFEWIKNGKESAGVIAQNVEEVMPRAVSEVDDLKDDDTHKVVDYNQLSALFIEAIKELKDENKQLRAEIEALKDINK